MKLSETDLLLFPELREKKPPFTTQAVLLKRFGKKGDPGLASPLANLYLISELENKKPTFLENAHEAYREAINLEYKIVDELKKGNNDALEHIGFIATKTPHEDKLVSKQTLINPENFKKEVSNAKHVLICYPTNHKLYFSEKEVAAMEKGNIPKIQTKTTVYYGQDLKNNQCTFFDADVKGGVRKGSCEAIQKQLVDLIASRYRENDDQAYIGKSISIPKPVTLRRL